MHCLISLNLWKVDILSQIFSLYINSMWQRVNYNTTFICLTFRHDLFWSVLCRDFFPFGVKKVSLKQKQVIYFFLFCCCWFCFVLFWTDSKVRATSEKEKRISAHNKAAKYGQPILWQIIIHKINPLERGMQRTNILSGQKTYVLYTLLNPLNFGS